MSYLFFDVLAAVAVGLVILFFFLGLSSLNGRSQQDQRLHDMVESITRSEIELERVSADIPNRRTWTGFWYDMATKGGYFPDNKSQPGLLAIGIAVFALLVGIFVWPRDILGGVLILGIGEAGLFMFYRIQSNRRLRRLEKQLPGLLSGLRANLHANNTPQQAILNQAEEMTGPLGDELKIVRDELALGVSLDTALSSLAVRVNSKEVKFLVASIRIAVDSGSDLEPLLVQIQDIMTARAETANKLSSAIANSQPALVVSGFVIPAAFIYMYYSSPSSQSYWSSVTGLITLAIVVVLYAAGLFISKKLVDRIKNA